MKSLYIKNSLKTLGLASAIMLGTASCSDLLKENVISSISNDYIATTPGFIAATNAAYTPLRSFYATERGLTMSEYGTDIYSAGADGSYKGFHFYDSQLTSSVVILAELWDETYKGINTINAVIDRAPSVTGITEAVKAQRVAEMKYLRAHYYFVLVQQFGPLDLRLKETTGPTKTATRATEQAVYKQIEADLLAAIPALENKKASSDYGRATKAAAENLLAKVYLTRASSKFAEASDYANAATLCNNVINNYGFKLLSDFASVFDQANQVNDEVIFAVQYTSDPLTNGFVDNQGNKLHLYFGMQYDVQPGMQRDVVNGRPFKRLKPTPYLLNTVFADRVNDTRYSKTFKDTWLSNKPGTYNTTFDGSKSTVTYKAGDTTIFIPGYEMPLAERAKKKYQVLVPSLYNFALFPTLKKFFDPLRPDMTYENGSRDFFVHRLADTYLMLAEASVKLGKQAEAVAAINAVRVRAAAAGKAEDMKVTSVDMNLIMEERARELAGEQTRWMDLKRWGNLVERVKLYNSDAAANVADRHYVRPIPQKQVDLSENGGFPQNSGY
ncbi:RagB/SusD family nutrient uptake outer membrane protein [Aquirufa regiilacus]|uniref:RagB/SusD family nutrient uptake outer membrane protein n=1 Tax=Aquirufa regiilacus TaxID=3024868 RepID=A0ABU3TQW7_9BACT|nr:MULTISPECIES: RagB/SusD family nutrient uptake outer membrane protein [unclassified Aquirufa]MDT8886780.1 RagB/SusD family nutrient uptake outer membrane protein [Aquirufa sp. LEPPI-3A]MDU0808255.1 RagB/SusD family nutrient uptake outer membrane protein [Aquirufa sp. LEOWEIH-7C]